MDTSQTHGGAGDTPAMALAQVVEQRRSLVLDVWVDAVLHVPGVRASGIGATP